MPFVGPSEGCVRMLGRTGEESPPALLSRSRCYIRLGEISTLEQKRLIQILGQSIGKTVALVAYSGPNRPLIPIESGHLFRGKPAGDSGAK